jgi:hypothetical protein
MGLRPANRSIETFDISLMAVVTKAMGAFLVLMLLLVPSYVAMPDLRRQLAGEEGASRALEKDATSLTEENRVLERPPDPSRERVLRERVAALEQENKRLTQGAGLPAMLVFFSWADCDADIDFYITGSDASGWPPMRPAHQPVPPGVYEYPQAQLAGLLFDLVDPAAAATDFITHRLAKQRLWIIKAVPPKSTYTFYAKVYRLRGHCDVTATGLLTAADAGNWRSYVSPGASFSSSPERFTHLITEGNGLRRAVILDQVAWDGTTLDWRHLKWPNAATEPELQQKLDRVMEENESGRSFQPDQIQEQQR